MRLLLAVGPPRTATTWLDLAFRSNPGILAPRRKELNYFDLYYMRGLTWYLGQFGKPSAERELLLAEACPSYASNLAVIDRVGGFIGEVKVVISVRDPVERAVSSWRMRLRRNNLKMSFSEYVSEYVEAVRDSSFSEFVPRWLEAMDPADIRLLDSQSLDDPIAVMSSLASWAGVPNEWEFPSVRVNPGGRAKHPRLMATATNVGRGLRGAGLERVLEWSPLRALQSRVGAVMDGSPDLQPRAQDVASLREILGADYLFLDRIARRRDLWL